MRVRLSHVLLVPNEVRLRYHSVMAFILWLIAVILVVAGIVQIVQRQYLFGAILIVVGLLVGPGGVSIFT
jgi:hypothetical protein